MIGNFQIRSMELKKALEPDVDGNTCSSWPTSNGA